MLASDMPAGADPDRARATRRRELGAAARLALVPVGVALTLGMLLLPRRGEPDSVPVPIPDGTALARTEASDHELAEKARSEPLPGPVRSLGSALRAFHSLEPAGDERLLGDARHAVDSALIDAVSSGGASADPLLRLRAVQLEQFMVEVHAFEATGVQSPELEALAGAFVRSMTGEGWCTGHTLALPDPALRALYKQMWTTFLGLDARKELALSLDETRALYAFYLAHPHPSPGMREAIASARRGAHDASTYEALDLATRAAVETWRLDRIARLAELDPQYPAAYAKGVANLRRGKYSLAANAFRSWLASHPDGPLALRAQTFLRRAEEEEGIE